MPIRLSRFEMPHNIDKDESTATGTYARFVEQNPLKVEDYIREGCAEDVTDIILNLKRVLLKSYTRDLKSITLKKKGPCTVYAGDFAEGNSIEVLNPRQEICTLEADGSLDLECELKIGRGFCLADANKTPDQEIGRIAIDSIFSPVTRVNFLVENTRVGQRTDYEKLILDVWTDGRVTPDDALKTAAAVLRRHLDVFVDYAQEEILEFDEDDNKGANEREHLRKLLNMSVNEIELSVRAANCLNNANIATVGELVSKTEADMLKYRNFGKKSLTEIKDKLKELGLCLGYKFDADLLESKK